MKRIWIVFLALLVLLAGCGGDGAEEAADSAADESAVGDQVQPAEQADGAEGADIVQAVTLATGGPIDPGYTDRDLAGTWDEADAEYIPLEGGTVNITEAGVYVLSGTLVDGQVIVEADKSDKVQLVFDGVSISCSDGPAVHIKTADKVFITLAEGTENTLEDGADYTLAEGEDEPNAALYSKEDLIINGSGALTVTANYRHGLNSKDDLKITGGQITVTAAEDGLRGKDCVAICGGEISIIAGGDGIKSNNAEGEDVGWISIDGGTVTITAGEDGVQAESTLQVTGGALDIVAGGGSVEPANSGSTGFPGSNWDREDEDNASAKGIKAGSALYILDGTILIDALDDTVHSNGDITIAGGDLTLASGDDGIHADGTLSIQGGVILITRSYEGLEAEVILISGGETRLTATDDGVNASDGSGSSGFGPGGGGSGGDSNIYLRISGGLLVVDAAGDGIDSNGDFYMDGGTVIVNGPTSGGDGALDFSEGTGEITGGTIVAVGASMMAENFHATSTQPALMVNYSSTQSAGTPLALTDSSGNLILAFTPEKDYSSVVISSPDMAVGETYTLYTGGTAQGEGTDGLVTGAYSPGQEVVTVTLESTATSIADTGQAVSGGMGGGMPGGGRGGSGGRSGERSGNGEVEIPADSGFSGGDAPDSGGEMPGSGGGPSTDGDRPM